MSQCYNGDMPEAHGARGVGLHCIMCVQGLGERRRHNDELGCGEKTRSPGGQGGGQAPYTLGPPVRKMPQGHKVLSVARVGALRTWIWSLQVQPRKSFSGKLRLHT